MQPTYISERTTLESEKVYLPVVLNPEATTKKEVVAKKRDNILYVPVPLEQNGFVVCGFYKNDPLLKDHCLVVVDFDAKENVSLSIHDLLLHKLPPTLVVRTPSGGYHVYLYIMNNDVGCFQFKNLTQFASVSGIKEVDIRGVGGIAIAPGTIITREDGTQAGYVIESYNKVAFITYDEFIKYISLFVEQKEEKDTTTPIVGEKFEEYIRSLPIRRAFKDILRGRFIIDHVSQENTGIPEFQYWAAFWREILWAGLEPETIFPILEITQPEFSVEKTRQQLKYLENRDKRPSSEFYARLFPEYKNDVIDELLTENKVLLRRIERLEYLVNEILVFIKVKRK